MQHSHPAFEVIVGTAAGVVRAGRNAQPLGLDGHRVSAVHAFRGEKGAVVILGGTYGGGLYRSVDEGASWAPVEGLWAPAARTIGPDPLVAGALLCGTEPGRLFRSTDEGRSWSELPGIGTLPGQDEWYLPYSPRAGAIRNVYAPAHRPGHLLSSLEVGGLLRTLDGGETWSIGPIGPNDDIHQVAGHPHAPDTLWASLGYAALPSRHRDHDAPPLGGVARSRDGGQSWDVLHTEYTRSTIVVPSRPDLVLSGPAPSVGRGGRIEVSGDDGESWEAAATGIETPMPDMVELFVVAPDDSIFAICAGGRLLCTEPVNWKWRSALPPGQPENAVSVAFLPG
jgi:hypothetical protein